MNTVRPEPFDFAQDRLVEGLCFDRLSTNGLANKPGRVNKQPPARAGEFELRTENTDTRRLNDTSIQLQNKKTESDATVTKRYQNPIHFPRIKRRQVDVNFESGAISSDGGMMLLRELAVRLNTIHPSRHPCIAVISSIH